MRSIVDESWNRLPRQNLEGERRNIRRAPEGPAMDSSRQQSFKEENLATALRDVFEALCVSQNAFLEAAGKISDESVARLLYDVALARGQLALELRQFVSAGSPMKRDEGLLGQLRGLSRRIQAAVSENDSFLVLCDLEELESLLIRNVRGVVTATQGHQVHKLLERQLDHMKHSHDSVRRLRDVKKWPDRLSQYFQMGRAKMGEHRETHKRSAPKRGEQR